MAKKKNTGDPAAGDKNEKIEVEKETTENSGDNVKEEKNPSPAAEKNTSPVTEMIEKETYLRLAAEYENFRRRSQREKESIWSDAKASAVKELLPVYDNLERALKLECADEAFRKGVEMTLNQYIDSLKRLGVEEIPSQGEEFNADLHNAVMHVEDETAGENVIVECFQKGFKLGDKVIRFAMVKVAN